MVFALNEVIECVETNELRRVIWIDPSRINIVTIKLYDDHALPAWESFQDIEAAFTQGNIRVTHDPYDYLTCRDELISEGRIRYRDTAWNLVSPFIENHDNDLFDPWKRGPLITELAKNSGQRKSKIYFLLRRYWQRGQMANALLADFHSCGAPGKERLAPSSRHAEYKTRDGTAKIGNKRRGVRVTGEIKSKFTRAIKLFFHTRKKRGLKSTFELAILKFFNNGYEVKNGIRVPILPPATELPTYRQFAYWHRKYKKTKGEIIAREGEQAYNLRHRPVLGESTSKSFGPGSIYQIDATIGDAYLVSSLNRNWIIGRPVIYFVIDVFSRMVVGLYIGLEGPNWVGAMMALANAMTDKLDFCREHDIPDSEILWPCHHLCNELVADRGELLSPKANNLVRGLGIRVLNTGSCRGDWKGIVEQHIDLANEKTIHWVPGAVRWPRQWAERDYRLDAVLTLQEFRKLIILSTIDYNLNHRLHSYPMDRHMISQDIKPYAICLWHYGMQRFGDPRTRSSDIVKLNLLPTADAKVTHFGIRFHGLFYECDLALREGWFERPTRKNWYTKVVFDPRDPRTIYLPLNRGQKFESCHLTKRSRTFAECDLYEIDDFWAIGARKKGEAQIPDIQSSAYYQAQAQKIISEAQKITKESLSSESNSARLRNIRKNRQEEKATLRQKEAFDLTSKNSSKDVGRVIPFREIDKSKIPGKEPLSRPNYQEVLKKVRQERGNDNEE